jgi:hypothetical protein
MAATNKCLAQSNKSLRRGQAPKPYRAARRNFVLAKLANGQRCRLLHDRVIMRVNFEATGATGKVHKRSSTSRVYSHCVVIHFAAHPPSKLWPKGIAACSHAEWVASCALAERKASRWRKEPSVEAIEILEARQVSTMAVNQQMFGGE